MNIIKMELRLGRRGFIIWTISLALLLVLTAVFFTGFKDSMEVIENLLKAFPKSVIDSFGLDINIFSSFPAYLSYIMMYVLIAASIYSMQKGLYITSNEKTIGMSDFLLTKPASRTKVVVCKYIEAIIRIVLLNLVLFALSIGLNMIYDGSNNESIMNIFVAALLIECFFIALGAFISSLMKQNKSVLPIAMATAFIMFFITMIERVFKDDKLKYLSPFSHMDISKIVVTGKFDSTLVIVNVVLTIVLFTLSLIIYNRENFRK